MYTGSTVKRGGRVGPARTREQIDADRARRDRDLERMRRSDAAITRSFAEGADLIRAHVDAEIAAMPEDEPPF